MGKLMLLLESAGTALGRLVSENVSGTSEGLSLENVKVELKKTITLWHFKQWSCSFMAFRIQVGLNKSQKFMD